jgi:hypothetical protein
MLQTHDGPIIAWLKFAMTVTVNSETVPIILVQAFDKHENWQYHKKDRDMGFTHLWQ